MFSPSHPARNSRSLYKRTSLRPELPPPPAVPDKAFSDTPHTERNQKLKPPVHAQDIEKKKAGYGTGKQKRLAECIKSIYHQPRSVKQHQNTHSDTRYPYGLFSGKPRPKQHRSILSPPRVNQLFPTAALPITLILAQAKKCLTPGHSMTIMQSFL